MGSEGIKKLIDDTLMQNRIVIFSKSYCPFCTKAKKALQQLVDSSKIYVLEIEERPDCADIQNELGSRTGARSVPRVFIDGEFIGGGDETSSLAQRGVLGKMLESKGIV